jgi:hypothetical protein
MRQRWLAAASLCVAVLAACGSGHLHPAAFSVDSFDNSPCPADVSPTTSCFTVQVRNIGDTPGQAACSMYQYSKRKNEAVVQGDPTKTAVVAPDDDGDVLLTIDAREKQGLMLPEPGCLPGVPTDWG